MLLIMTSLNAHLITSLPNIFDGTQAWSWRFGGNDNDLAYDITTGSVNEIYVTGVTDSTQLFGADNSGYKDSSYPSLPLMVYTMDPPWWFFWRRDRLRYDDQP